MFSIKASVTEENGEISCSIEETNRIRALLGMKPLVIKAKELQEQKAVVNFKAKREQEQQEKEAQAIRDRIESAKNKRLLNASLGGSTLSTIEDADADISSASSWVERSREIAKKRKLEEAEKLAKRLAETEEQLLQNYDSKDLKGIQVMHADSDFDVGQEVVLTLADSSILETDDNGRFKGRLNANGDVLENVNFSERDRRLDREARKKKLKQPIYAGYDDAEFAEGGPVKALLPQYDPEKKSGPRLVLGVGDVNNQSVVEAEGSNAAEGTKKDAISLKIESKLAQDFYTPTEYASFSKSKSKDKDKKKRKIRKTTTDIDDQNESNGVQDMISRLEAEASEAGNADRGFRSAINSKAVDAETLDRRAGYEIAVQNAAEKVSNHRAFVKPSSAKRTALEIEDDSDLQRAIASTRRLAQLQQNRNQNNDANDGDEDKGAEFVKQLSARATRMVESATSLANEDRMDDGEAAQGIYMSHLTKNVLSHMSHSSNKEGDEELKFDEIDSEGRRNDGSLVFTTTTEFTTRLQARLNERARAKAEAAVKAASRGGNRDNDIEDDAQKKSIFSNWDGNTEGPDMEVVDVDSDLGSADGLQSNPDKGLQDEQLDFVQNQPLVGKGMAATLALLKSTGDLKPKVELAGRAKDARDNDPSSRDFGVKIEYRDEKGRLLTTKEAFRQICYRFHGFGPSRKTIEKRMQADENKNKSIGKKDSIEFGTMKSLIKAQEATGKAHVIVQGGVSNVNATELLKRSGGGSKASSSSSSSK